MANGKRNPTESKPNQVKQAHPNWGGPRPGSGRKKGSATMRLAAIAEKCRKEGITPLEIVIELMRDAYYTRGAQAALEYAEIALPYMHPKIAAIAMQVVPHGDGSGGTFDGRDLRELGDDDLLIIAAGGGEGVIDTEASED